jgi:hypothetical protein
VNEIVAFVEVAEHKANFNCFIDLPALDAVDLNFNFVFHVALDRPLSYAPNPPVKSAFYVTSPAASHQAKLHAMLTDYSPPELCLQIARSQRSGLGVPVETLTLENT